MPRGRPVVNRLELNAEQTKEQRPSLERPQANHRRKLLPKSDSLSAQSRACCARRFKSAR